MLSNELESHKNNLQNGRISEIESRPAKRDTRARSATATAMLLYRVSLSGPLIRLMVLQATQKKSDMCSLVSVRFKRIDDFGNIRRIVIFDEL